TVKRPPRPPWKRGRSAKPAVEPAEHLAVPVPAVARLEDPVVLVRIDEEPRRDLLSPEDCVDLEGLPVRDAVVLLTVDHEHRRLEAARAPDGVVPVHRREALPG